MWNPKIDLTGQTFGRWTVLGKDEAKPSYWICKCNCELGTVKSIYGGSLTKNLSQSCGCLQKEIVSKYNKKYNTYDLSGSYGIGFSSNTNKEFYFDLEDYDKIKDYCWTESHDGYLKGSSPSNWKVKKYIHRIIMECTDSNIFVDHINHNVFDNRKENLRLVTPAQNTYNKSIQPYNTSGEIGVYYHEKRNKWIAQIMINNQHYCVYCNSKEDAIEARRKMEDELFGEYGYHNSIETSLTIQN